MLSARNVCIEHFSDQILENLVGELVDHDLGADGSCDFCVHPSPGADLDSVAELVAGAINRHFQTAGDAGMPWDGEAGEWAFSTLDTADVVWDLGGIDDADVVDEIVARLEPEDWVPRNDPIRSEAEVLGGSWAGFQEHVMHVSRFLFSPDPPGDTDDQDLDLAPREVLPAIVGAIREEPRLIHTLPIGTPIYRARSFDRPLPFTAFYEMVAPPPSVAPSGRMNSAGIPVLYGAMEAETAAAEVYDGKGYAAIIELRTLRDLTVLDLSEIPRHSAYDPDVSLRRFQLAEFLRSFSETITRPIIRDARTHRDYAPTQITSEFLRWRLLSTGGELDGIMYPSSRGEASNIVVFVGPAGCLEDADLPPGVGRGRAERRVVRPGSNMVEIHEFLPPRTRHDDWADFDV